MFLIIWSKQHHVLLALSGSLCDGFTRRSYQLSVLDTVFVRTQWRRSGLALQILADFCKSLPNEEVIGISCPISPSMIKGGSVSIRNSKVNYVNADCNCCSHPCKDCCIYIRTKSDNMRCFQSIWRWQTLSLVWTHNNLWCVMKDCLPSQRSMSQERVGWDRVGRDRVGLHTSCTLSSRI